MTGRGCNASPMPTPPTPLPVIAMAAAQITPAEAISTNQPPAPFGRASRLLDGKSFAAVFECKRRLHGGSFTLYVAANALGYPRLGLAVSKRVSKKAVQRNRIKRIVRESFRRHPAKIGGVDCVVVAKPAAATRPNPTLRAEVERLWSKARQKTAP